MLPLLFEVSRDYEDRFYDTDVADEDYDGIVEVHANGVGRRIGCAYKAAINGALNARMP